MGDSWGNHIAITVEGVLKTPNDEAPIMSGVLLYKSLCKTHRITLILDSFNKEKLQYWLIVNSLTDHIAEVYWERDDPDDIVERRLIQVKRMKRDGPLSMVIESNMEVVAEVFKAGTPTMLYMHPQYIHPDFHPDAQTVVTPWNQLFAEQVRQREARAADQRLYNL